jgi:hypothetical protein
VVAGTTFEGATLPYVRLFGVGRASNCVDEKDR